MGEISVIVPVYNVEAYLSRCIESILNQSFTDFDLILVDDGSPDNCPLICDEYANKDKRIHVIHQANGGLSIARNVGIEYSIKNSDSHWITFIDSDDWVHIDFLKSLLNAVRKNRTEIAVCSFSRNPILLDSKIRFRTMTPEKAWCKYRTESTIACCKLYKKDLFRVVRFPERMYHEDEATTYKVLFTQNKISFTKSALYVYFINPNGITNSNIEKKHDRDRAINEQKQFFSENGFNKALVPIVLWELVLEMRNKRDSGQIKEYTRIRTILRLKTIKSLFLGILPIRQNYYTYRAAWPNFFNFIMKLNNMNIKLYF